MELKLINKTALVTASSSGIGLEIARSLVKEGARVIINGRTFQTVTEACEDISTEQTQAKLWPWVADNSTADGCEKTIREFPELDILVNNLGIYETVEFFQITDE